MRGQAVDGKEVRGTGAHGDKVHLLSLVGHGSGVVLAQQEVGEKSNEIPAVSGLLAGRDLKGAMITLDAMNTQRAMAQLIIDQGGHYLMVVKENQPGLHRDIKTFFEGTFLPQEDDRDTYTASDKQHGRFETRTLTCSEGPSGYLGWPGAKQVAVRRCLRMERLPAERSPFWLALPVGQPLCNLTMLAQRRPRVRAPHCPLQADAHARRRPLS